MLECKLPLDAKSTVCTGKPNSQTRILTWKCSITTEYLHGLRVKSLVFLETQYFFVNDGRGIGQFLKMSVSQSVANAKTPTVVNQVNVPRACRGHFPLTDFFCPQIAEYLKQFLPACLLSELDMQTWLWYTSSPCPLTGKLCIAPPLNLTEWLSVCVLGGFTVKTRVGRFKWSAQMATSKWNTSSSGAELL